MYKVVRAKDVPRWKGLWWAITSPYSKFTITINSEYVQEVVVFPRKQLICIGEPVLTIYGIRETLLKSKEWNEWNTELNAQMKSTFHGPENPIENEN